MMAIFKYFKVTVFHLIVQEGFPSTPILKANYKMIPSFWKFPDGAL